MGHRNLTPFSQTGWWLLLEGSLLAERLGHVPSRSRLLPELLEPLREPVANGGLELWHVPLVRVPTGRISPACMASCVLLVVLLPRLSVCLSWFFCPQRV